MIDLDPVLKKQLERDEDRRLLAYKDNATPPNWTIGIGHLLGSSPRMSSITDQECDALYAADLFDAAHAANNVFGLQTVGAILGLNEPRMRAILNMAFNRGEGNMRQSTTITPAIKKAIVEKTPEAWKAVSDAILASPWGQQIKSRGVRLAKQFETGVDQ